MHTSVLLEEALAFLAPSPGECLVDGTLGFGGHAARILERLAPDGKLIAFDKDPDALSEAWKSLDRFGVHAVILQDDFKNIGRHLAKLNISRVNGMLLDLGVSSMQLDRPDRGFSFQTEGPLDMRMDPGQRLTAAEIVNRYPAEQIADILYRLGEERFSRRIAAAIERARSVKPLETTSELVRVIVRAVPPAYRHGRIHAATRSFQALRLAVNGELESLGTFLETAPDFLAEGGRLVILSFHSLEDRMVKTAFRRFQNQKKGKILTKKPVTAGEAEIRQNPRARSAKLRAFLKKEERGQ